MSLDQHIVEATTEIFSTMLMMEVSPEPPMEVKERVHKNSVSGMIGMAGLYKGMLAIHAPEAVAKTITTNFLGIEVEEIDDDVKDAIGELANMLGGSLKAALSENGKDIKLSIPSAICGEEYSLECNADSQGAVVPFRIPEGTFTVELQVQKQG